MSHFALDTVAAIEAVVNEREHDLPGPESQEE